MGGEQTDSTVFDLVITYLFILKGAHRQGNRTSEGVMGSLKRVRGLKRLLVPSLTAV